MYHKVLIAGGANASSELASAEVFDASTNTIAATGNTLATANVITTIIASIAFSQFFLLTLYLQQVLHYSAAESGVAFTAIAGTVAVMSNVAQRFVTRFGPRRVLAAGLLFMASSEAYLIRLRCTGTTSPTSCRRSSWWASAWASRSSP